MGGSRWAPPPPRGGPITVGSSAHAGALPQGAGRTRGGNAAGTCCDSASRPAEGRQEAGPGRAVAVPPPPQPLLGRGPWATRRGAACAAKGTLGERRTRGPGTGKKGRAALRCQPGTSARTPSRPAGHHRSRSEMSAAGVRGLRATYHRLLDKVELMLPEKLRPLYNHPAGPKTVFFWAPIMKWGLVCAGLADMARPAEKLSTAQSAVLMATGLIWSRYSLVIIPKNWSLFAVNFFVGAAGASQLFRIWRYNQELQAKANK